MTMEHQVPSSAAGSTRPSLLPFDPADLVAIRVKPAQFARMCEVSKQTVSQWIKQGKVTIGPDGKLDPAVAARRVFETTDPGRLRARVFKNAVAGRDELQSRIAELEAELQENRERHAHEMLAAKYSRDDEFQLALTSFTDFLIAEAEQFAAACRAGLGEDYLDELCCRYFWPEVDAAGEEGLVTYQRAD